MPNHCRDAITVDFAPAVIARYVVAAAIESAVQIARLIQSRRARLICRNFDERLGARRRFGHAAETGEGVGRTIVRNRRIQRFRDIHRLRLVLIGLITRRLGLGNLVQRSLRLDGITVLNPCDDVTMSE